MNYLNKISFSNKCRVVVLSIMLYS